MCNTFCNTTMLGEKYEGYHFVNWKKWKIENALHSETSDEHKNSLIYSLTPLLKNTKCLRQRHGAYLHFFGYFCLLVQNVLKNGLFVIQVSIWTEDSNGNKTQCLDLC